MNLFDFLMTLKDLLNEKDNFAKRAGCRIEELRDGYARAVMNVGKEHLNAAGVCQGGALFTLADLALAAVMNSRGNITLGLQNNIMFLRSAKLGDVLTAEATEVYNHHKIPCVEVKVSNANGDLICAVTGLAYRKSVPTDISLLE